MTCSTCGQPPSCRPSPSVRTVAAPWAEYSGLHLTIAREPSELSLPCSLIPSGSIRTTARQPARASLKSRFSCGRVRVTQCGCLGKALRDALVWLGLVEHLWEKAKVAVLLVDFPCEALPALHICFQQTPAWFLSLLTQIC